MYPLICVVRMVSLWVHAYLQTGIGDYARREFGVPRAPFPAFPASGIRGRLIRRAERRRICESLGRGPKRQQDIC